MTISPSSIAAGVSTMIEGATFSPAATRLDRKPLLIGTYDSSKTAIVADQKYFVNSADEVGSLFGFGYELHRMSRAFVRGWGSAGFTVVPVTETSAAATITISIVGTATETRPLDLYFAGDHAPTDVIKDDDGAAVVAKLNTVIANDINLPVSSVINATPTQLDVTVKSDGVWGNYVTAIANLGLNQQVPAGLTLTITHNDDGAGTPDIEDALNGLGTGTNQNEDFYTGLAHSCLLDTTSLDLLTAYNGSADNETGNHDGEIGRFFQAVTGDVTAGSSGYTALKAITDLRKDDMTNAVVWRPGSPNHPVEIACVALGIREKKAIATPEQNYVDDDLPGIWPGDDTDDYNGNQNLDLAVKAGITTTKKSGTSSLMQDFVTMYRPNSVPVESNIWRSMRHQAVSQNIVWNNMNRFKIEKWKNITIVEDISKVTDIVAKQKARDIDGVVGELISLARQYEGLGFLYNSTFTIDTILADIPSYVQIRAGGKGFDYVMPVIYSGEGGIITGLIKADANTAAANV